MPYLLSRKSVALLICLAYLFIGAGGARAFFVCYQPDGSSHAEFKPSGFCDSDCDQGASPGSVGQNGLVGSPDEENCRDVPVLLAQAKNNRSDGTVLLNIETVLSRPAVIFPQFTEVQEQTLLSPNPPPPSQTLAALRTIVLLI